MKEVDIIIAAKNVGPYIYDCLTSCYIRKNNFVSHIHIINDGSSDNTESEIARFIADNNPIIHWTKTDGIGPANARNQAIEQANSPFVAFVDGDDLISSRALEAIIHQMEIAGAEIACPRVIAFDHYGGFQYEHDRPDLKRNVIEGKPYYLTNSFDFPQLLDLETSMCMRVFRRSFLEKEDIRFQDLMFCEDVFPSRVSFLRSSKVILSNEQYYFYRCNRPNQRTSQKEKSTIDIIKSIDKSVEFALANGLTPAQGGWFARRICGMILWGSRLVPGDALEEYSTLAVAELNRIPKAWWSELMHIVEHGSWIYKLSYLFINKRSEKSLKRIIYFDRYRFSDRLRNRIKERMRQACSKINFIN